MAIKQLLGKRIREIRKARKMTQEQLAERIEIETSSVSNIENGKYYPTAENLDKIIAVLNINPFDLFMTDYNDKPEKLLKEMTEAMNGNDELVRIMYKFYLTVKYQNCKTKSESE